MDVFTKSVISQNVNCFDQVISWYKHEKLKIELLKNLPHSRLEKEKNSYRLLVFPLRMDEYKSFTIISKNICLH